MIRLIPFELGRIWRKRSFLLSVCVLLALHLFLLWYTTLPDEDDVPLSAYKLLVEELSGKSEEEKERCIAGWKETIDGVCFVRDVLAMQAFQNEMGNTLAKQEMQDHPGRFEKYYGQYQSGGYLKFTGSLEQEQAFVDEIYAEQQKVSGYGEYLRSIQENKTVLSKISIFGGQQEDTYSHRNLLKSAADYADLSDETIRFVPSKGIVTAMQNVWTDLLLVLNCMLFVGSLIAEEKEKKLFFITRSTKYGVFHSIAAKITALFVHCVFVTALFYMVSVVFFGQSAGWPDFGAGLQSVAAYTESSLSVSILGYLLLSVLTKALVLFGIGAALMVFSILCGITALPFLAGAGLIGGSALLYYVIPAGSIFSAVKYLSPVGLLKTENMYGGYLNFNLLGAPVSRLVCSLGLIFLICMAGIGANLWVFCHMRTFEARKLHLPFSIPFRPHAGMLRHECYKILVTNRALPVLLVFAVLLVYRSAGRSYLPSVEEQYYQSMMMELEGELTDEKEKLIASEKARYDEAFEKIERLERMVEEGGLSLDAADDLKAQANMTLAFYPAFERVEEQYARIRKDGGGFVYDTGYLFLFGVLEDSFSVDFLILSIGLLLAASGAVSMEYQNGSLYVIGAAKAGKRKIMICKALILSVAAAVLVLISAVCRMWRIASVYPMHAFFDTIRNIPYFSAFAVSLPVGCFLILFLLSQIVAAVLVTWLTMVVSGWRKNQVQTIFFALLFLAVPMLLKLLGFSFAGWASLYPLYGWTGML